jgi:hypothetical protein
MSMTIEPLIVATALGIGAFATIMVAHFVLADRRRTLVAGQLLHRWASKRGLQFQSLERKWFRLGPFWLLAGYAAVFRGVAVTAEGHEQAGYFRVGTFGGVIGEDDGLRVWDRNPDEVSDELVERQIRVIWDDSPN